MQRCQGIFYKTIKKKSTAKWAHHHVEYTLEPILMNTNGLVNLYQQNVKKSTAEGRDNIYNIQFTKSGYFQINSRLYADVFLDILTLIKKAQSDLCFDSLPDDFENAQKKLKIIKKGFEKEFKKNGKLKSLQQRDLDILIPNELEQYFPSFDSALFTENNILIIRDFRNDDKYNKYKKIWKHDNDKLSYIEGNCGYTACECTKLEFIDKKKICFICSEANENAPLLQCVKCKNYYHHPLCDKPPTKTQYSYVTFKTKYKYYCNRNQCYQNKRKKSRDIEEQHSFYLQKKINKT